MHTSLEGRTNYMTVFINFAGNKRNTKMEQTAQHFDDTICAISTPPGRGGIAVARVSGRDATAIVARCWEGADLVSMASHTAHWGRIIDTTAGGDARQVLDEVVLTLFRAPRSFTGEDVVEISCHGSPWIQQQLLQVLVSCGCRMATAGEFTRRAFANGRIDLSQAEAVADVIASSSRAAHRIAMSQMRGSFSKQIGKLRDSLLEFVSLMELELDFSEEEVEFADRQHLLALATGIRDTIDHLAGSFAVGNAIKNGIPVAIVGETNAGKSTLLNLLLGDDRAIVSDIHGTTRDVIEDTITIGSVLYRFIDTAGIRDTTNSIESMGIERTFRKLDDASIVLWVIDGTAPAADIATIAPKILPHCAGKSLIAVVNKDDVISNDQRAAIATTLDGILPSEACSVNISARLHSGTDTLLQLITRAASIPENDPGEVIVTNARHYEALTRASQALARAIDGLRQGLSGDFVSQDIRECTHHLGEITGTITTTDILTQIFSHFCIGK